MWVFYTKLFAPSCSMSAGNIGWSFLEMRKRDSIECVSSFYQNLNREKCLPVRDCSGHLMRMLSLLSLQKADNILFQKCLYKYRILKEAKALQLKQLRLISGISSNVMSALKQTITLTYHTCPFRLKNVSVNVRHMSINCSCTVAPKTEKMLRISYSYKIKGEFSFL